MKSEKGTPVCASDGGGPRPVDFEQAGATRGMEVVDVGFAIGIHPCEQCVTLEMVSKLTS